MSQHPMCPMSDRNIPTQIKHSPHLAPFIGPTTSAPASATNYTVTPMIQPLTSLSSVSSPILVHEHLQGLGMTPDGTRKLQEKKNYCGCSDSQFGDCVIHSPSHTYKFFTFFLSKCITSSSLSTCPRDLLFAKASSLDLFLIYS